MTQHSAEHSTSETPDGSIFLSKIDHSEREFQNWRLALLLGRGAAKDICPEQRYDIDRAIQHERLRASGAEVSDEV